MVEVLTVERAGELFAGLLPAPGPVRAVSRFAEGSVTGAYRIEFAGADPAPVVLKIYDAGSLRFAVKEARALRFLTGHGLLGCLGGAEHDRVDVEQRASGHPTSYRSAYRWGKGESQE